MRPTLGWLCVAFAFVCGVAIIVPFAPSMPRLDLDGSWPLAINMAAFQHLVFGRDIIFTAGPLSAIYTHQYFPGTDTKAVLGAAGLAVVTLVALIHAIPRARRPWLLLLPAVMTLYGMTDMIFLLVPWLLVVIAAHKVRLRPLDVVLMHLLACTCALLPLIKGSGTLSAVACVGLAALILSRTRTIYLVSMPVTFLVALVGLWRLSGQAIHDLPGYFKSQSTVISGYGDAMNVSGPPDEVWLFVAAAFALLTCCLLLSRPVKLPVLVVTAMTLLVSFKAGMIRHDGHASFAACALIVVGAYLFFALHRGWRYVALAMGVVPGFIIMSHYVDVSPAATVARLQDTVSDQVEGAFVRLFDRQALDREYAAAVATIRKSVPLKGDGHTADLFPSDTSALIFSTDRWIPRPTFQSYASYTPDLIQKNVEHFRKAAPERLYFRIDSIDHRYPSLDDAAVWPWLLATYRPVDIIGDYLLLGRNGLPQALPVAKPLFTRSVAIGESVALPSGEPLWATIKLRPSFAGKLVGVLFKRPVIVLHLQFANGLQDSYRVIPGMTETGFLLSPTVRSSQDFLALWTGDRAAWQPGNIPVSMQLELPDGGSAMWQATYELAVAPLPIPPVAKPEPAADQMSAAPVVFEAGGQCNIEKVDGTDITGSEALVSKKKITFSGWGTISSSMGIAHESLSLLVQQADGKKVLVAARKTLRGDIGVAFHHDSIIDSGYEVTVDTSSLSLPARVTVVQTLGGVSVECPQRVITLVRKP